MDVIQFIRLSKYSPLILSLFCTQVHSGLSHDSDHGHTHELNCSTKFPDSKYAKLKAVCSEYDDEQIAVVHNYSQLKQELSSGKTGRRLILADAGIYNLEKTLVLPKDVTLMTNEEGKFIEFHAEHNFQSTGAHFEVVEWRENSRLIGVKIEGKNFQTAINKNPAGSSLVCSHDVKQFEGSWLHLVGAEKLDYLVLAEGGKIPEDSRNSIRQRLSHSYLDGDRVMYAVNIEQPVITERQGEEGSFYLMNNIITIGGDRKEGQAALRLKGGSGDFEHGELSLKSGNTKPRMLLKVLGSQKTYIREAVFSTYATSDMEENHLAWITTGAMGKTSSVSFEMNSGSPFLQKLKKTYEINQPVEGIWSENYLNYQQQTVVDADTFFKSGAVAGICMVNAQHLARSASYNMTIAHYCGNHIAPQVDFTGHFDFEPDHPFSGDTPASTASAASTDLGVVYFLQAATLLAITGSTIYIKWTHRPIHRNFELGWSGSADFLPDSNEPIIRAQP